MPTVKRHFAHMSIKHSVYGAVSILSILRETRNVAYLLKLRNRRSEVISPQSCENVRWFHSSCKNMHLSDSQPTLAKGQNGGLNRRRPTGALCIPPTKLYHPSQALSDLCQQQSAVTETTTTVEQDAVLLGAVRC